MLNVCSAQKITSRISEFFFSTCCHCFNFFYYFSICKAEMRTKNSFRLSDIDVTVSQT